jgi:hypothetical protein
MFAQVEGGHKNWKMIYKRWAQKLENDLQKVGTKIGK